MITQLPAHIARQLAIRRVEQSQQPFVRIDFSRSRRCAALPFGFPRSCGMALGVRCRLPQPWGPGGVRCGKKVEIAQDTLYLFAGVEVAVFSDRVGEPECREVTLER